MASKLKNSTRKTTGHSRSRQFCFYAMSAELKSLDAVIEMGNCLILPTTFDQLKDASHNVLPLDSKTYTTGMVYVVPKPLLDQVHTSFVKEQGYSTIRRDISPVIEISFPSVRKNVLRMGRFYCLPGYWGRDGWVGFDPMLMKVYERLVSTTKRELLSEKKHLNKRLSQGAIQFVESGGELGNIIS